MKALLGVASATLLVIMASCSKDTAPPPPAGGDVALSSEGSHVAQCHPTCGTAADCAVPGAALESASHFTCTGGTCQWQGCQSDAECNADAPTGAPNLVCRTAPDSPMPTCVPSCASPSDCASPGDALTTASHFACNAGVCEWLGCKSTAECASSLHVQKVVCETPPGAPGATCEPTCNTPADCANSGAPLEDASHFACKANRCVWLGCKSTHDCTSGLHSANFVCE